MTARAPDGVDFRPARAVADAVLYEGYLLYPYRRSSQKNKVRWQFGVLAPRSWAEVNTSPAEGVAGSAESWWSRTECLLEAPPDAVLEVLLRFLELEPGASDANGEPFDRGRPREIPFRVRLGELSEEQEQGVDIPGRGRLAVRHDRIPGPFRLHRISARVENTVAEVPPTASRVEALRHAMVSTHLLLGVRHGSFLSGIEPPEWAAPAAARCRNVRTFPVLAGPPGTAHLMISAPIILPDHPSVAPESPGDLFDATEIDEILSLRTMTLTDEEKAEVRATDPRAARLLDRVDHMPPEMLSRLHGAIRSLRPVRPAREDPGMGPGTRVRLRPRKRGTDVQDMFLDGRTATVDSVLTDVDGSRFLAVCLDDDPRTEMGAGPGRLLHFSPEEVEQLV